MRKPLVLTIVFVFACGVTLSSIMASAQEDYNILMILGISSVITGIAVVPGMFTDYLIMIGFAVVLIAFLRSGIIPRPAGIGLVIAYAAYLGYTLLS